MDIYFNGIIYLNDSSGARAEAMAVKDGRIAAVGHSKEILRMASRGDRIMDLEGDLILPGFVDTHMHFLEYAAEKSFADLSSSSSLEELLSILKAGLDDAVRSGMPLRGTGFDHNTWASPVLPTRGDLDGISREIPIIINRSCHHITVVNTPALKASGLEDQCPDGILRENQQYILEETLPAPSKDQIKALVLDAARDAASRGITQVQTDDLPVISSELYGRTILEAYAELDREGQLPIRVYQQCNLPSMERLNAFLTAGYMTGQSTGHFTIGPLKLIGDGALGARSAAMRDGYRDQPDNRGILNFTDDELLELVSAAHHAGMQVAVHGIGDRCIEQILDTYEAVLREYPRPNHRHGIVHCQITRPDDIRRMADMGIMAYIQPVFLRADQHITEERIGPELTVTSYAWRAMADLGIHLGGGSDCPVEPFDVLPNMYYAVTCREPGADRPWYPQKALTLDETIRAFTSEGAYASFTEDRLGKLLPGFTADFTVVDRDVTVLPPESLCEAQTVMTFVDGKMIYEAR